MAKMIPLTKSGSPTVPLIVNSDHIVTVTQGSPNTMVVFDNGSSITVTESATSIENAANT